MEEINKNEPIHGYKVFNSNWTCRDKQYTCPGKFEEDVNPHICSEGMHFCKIAADCFNYYRFDPSNKVAEVVAYGEVEENGSKCCTNRLEIVREIPWSELLTIVNTGKDCTGLCNTGNWNAGNDNTGNNNTGNWNAGNDNTGNCNTGNWNAGNNNTGNCNTGNWNAGNWNAGNWNAGNGNTGNWNAGNGNTGNGNTGNWNKTDFSNGCFNTVEQRIYLFNKPSEWTYKDWFGSEVYTILQLIPSNRFEYVFFGDMTEEEKSAYPEAKTTGGYIKPIDETSKRQDWWNKLSKNDKAVIKSLPNFDSDIFKEVTGIDVTKD